MHVPAIIEYYHKVGEVLGYVYSGTSGKDNVAKYYREQDEQIAKSYNEQNELRSLNQCYTSNYYYFDAKSL